MTILIVHLELAFNIYQSEQNRVHLNRRVRTRVNLSSTIITWKFTEVIKDNYCVIKTVETLLTMSFKLLELASCPSPSDQYINTLVAGRDSFKGGEEELPQNQVCCTHFDSNS